MIARLVLDHSLVHRPASPQIYALSLHDALPILPSPDNSFSIPSRSHMSRPLCCQTPAVAGNPRDRKSTRLNSSHPSTSYAVFCLKKKSCTQCSPMRCFTSSPPAFLLDHSPTLPI